MPHKKLWRLTDADGVEIACELETLTSNRILLTVARNGTPIVTETFADKRDALARSVGLYREMKGTGIREQESGGSGGSGGSEGSEPPDS